MTIYGDYPCDHCEHAKRIFDCWDCIFHEAGEFDCQNEKCRLHDGSDCRFGFEGRCGAAIMEDSSE